MLLSKGAAAPGLSWGRGGEGEAECEFGVSLDVPSTEESVPGNPGGQRGDANFPGEVLPVSGLLAVSWVTLGV